MSNQKQIALKLSNQPTRCGYKDFLNGFWRPQLVHAYAAERGVKAPTRLFAQVASNAGLERISRAVFVLATGLRLQLLSRQHFPDGDGLPQRGQYRYLELFLKDGYRDVSR